MYLLPELLFLIAAAYQWAVMYASGRFLLRRRYPPSSLPPVSILKPVRGLDESLEEALRSHLDLDYPEYEVLIGVASLGDPAVPVIESLIAGRPHARLIVCPTAAPNAKAGKLIDLARSARHDLLLVNDSDITVPAFYLRRVTAPLADPAIGLVTCPYRAHAGSAAGRWEAFGIAIDFVPSTLVAPLVGVNEFGLGSTLCFRREDLKTIGGFEAVADYIADDYQLARRIAASGRRCYMSEVVVETHLNSPSWRQAWLHQVRWARTIRVSRGDGYLGLPVTHAGVWAAVLLLMGRPELAALLSVTRVASAVTAGFVALRHGPSLPLAPLAPLWDLFAFCVWLTGLAGRTVRWRSGTMRLSRDGRILARDGDQPAAAD